MSRRRRARSLALIGPCATLCLALTACGANTSDLRDYVARIKNQKARPVEPMPEIARYKPVVYSPSNHRSPFAAPRDRNPHSDNGIRPDRDRSLDALEQFPIDALRMVGTISINGTDYALITAPDQIVHRVSVGDHMGRHYGRIDSIGANGLALTEIVSDGNGSYVKRSAALSAPKTDRGSSPQ